MYISIDVDIDEICSDQTDEVIEALKRNGHYLHEPTEILKEIKEARLRLTALIRLIEGESYNGKV